MNKIILMENVFRQINEPGMARICWSGGVGSLVRMIRKVQRFLGKAHGLFYIAQVKRNEYHREIA
jgi:hypothetical protein